MPPSAAIVPELQRSGFGDATVRQLLDMTTGLDYSEDYADENSPVWNLGRAVGFLPIPPGYAVRRRPMPTCLAEKAGAHGERFVYKTANTDALAWVLRRSPAAAGELLRDRLFVQLGAEQDATSSSIRSASSSPAAGCTCRCATWPGSARLMRLGGRFNGAQIVPKAFVDDVRRGGDRDHFAGAGYKMLPGCSYRSMWWVSHNDHGAFAARGIHGQAIYVDPAAEMVIARFASHPLGANANMDPTSLPPSPRWRDG